MALSVGSTVALRRNAVRFLNEHVARLGRVGRFTETARGELVWSSSKRAGIVWAEPGTEARWYNVLPLSSLKAVRP